MFRQTSVTKRLCQGLIALAVTVAMLAIDAKSPARAADDQNQSLGKTVFEKSILGKDYRIQTVEGEPGKYWVTWGSEKMKWEPKPWYEDELNEKGPMLYTEWLQPLYWPYTIPLEDREKMQPFDVMDVAIPFWPVTPGMSSQDRWIAHLYAPGAEYMRVKDGYEWNAYLSKAKTNPNWIWDPTPPADLAGQAYRKYMVVFVSPRDLAKVSFLQVQYHGKDKEDENYLYVPTVRKVRRLATANRQDVLGGLILRQEQNALLTPIHNYKIVGSGLMDYPDKDRLFGLGAGEVEQQSPDPKVKHLDGLGEPCWIIETTPFRPDWWFAKQITYVGVLSLQPLRQDSFDSEGRIVQREQSGYALAPAGETSTGVPNCCRKTHRFWDALSLKDYTTGFWLTFYAEQKTLNPPIPDTLFNVQSLLLEPKSVDFYAH